MPAGPCAGPEPRAEMDAPAGDVAFLVASVKDGRQSPAGRDFFGRVRHRETSACP